MKDLDASDITLYIFFTIIILFIGVLATMMFIGLKNKEEAIRHCREMPYEEYKVDTRCHELLED